MKFGVYIHMPFCHSRCIYCGFYSTTMVSVQHRYVDCLLKELRMRYTDFTKQISDTSNTIIADTIYIGGGTPSTLHSDEICRLLQGIKDIVGAEQSEITMEVNPDDVSLEYIQSLAKFGVNRISMGVQSFNNDILHFIHRRHNADQAIIAAKTIRQAGIDNISMDLMYGFPGQSLEQWQDDINKIIAINPTHISAYSLMYEEGTTLHHMLTEGTITPINEEVSLAMYNRLVCQLKEAGYEHYEISNFAKPGYRSIHNSSYWKDTPYIGLGASAHSYSLNKRSWNVANLNEYMQAIENSYLPSDYEDIDADTHYNDIVTTAMRTAEGINLDILPSAYRQYALNNAKDSIKYGLIEIADNHLRLTSKGIFVSDMVMSSLIKI